MSVGVNYLAKIKRAVRLTSTASDIIQELIDTIEEARVDLTRLGIPAGTAASETDYNILDAVKRYARWRFAMDPNESAQCSNEYKEKADELRRMRDYAYLTITFMIQDGDDAPIADATVTFNGETVETGADGLGVFYYCQVGTNQEYTVSADGYDSQTVDIDVTVSATVTVTMT